MYVYEIYVAISLSLDPKDHCLRRGLATVVVKVRDRVKVRVRVWVRVRVRACAFSLWAQKVTASVEGSRRSWLGLE